MPRYPKKETKHYKLAKSYLKDYLTAREDADRLYEKHKAETDPKEKNWYRRLVNDALKSSIQAINLAKEELTQHAIQEIEEDISEAGKRVLGEIVAIHTLNEAMSGEDFDTAYDKNFKFFIQNNGLLKTAEEKLNSDDTKSAVRYLYGHLYKTKLPLEKRIFVVKNVEKLKEYLEKERNIEKALDRLLSEFTEDSVNLFE